MKLVLAALSALIFPALTVAGLPSSSPASDLRVVPTARIGEFPVKDILDRSRLTDLSRPIPAQANARSRSGSHAEFLGNVQISPGLLTLPTEYETSIPTINRLPRQLAQLRLSVGAEEFVLMVVDVTSDEKAGMRHVTAKLLSHFGGYARFTIDDRLQAVAGTIRVGSTTYRLVPLGHGQEVYRLRSEGGRVSSLERTQSASTPEVQRIERRHLQAELVAERNPWFVSVSKNAHLVRWVGGDLGFLDVDNATSASIGQLLASLHPFTGATGEESFRIVSKTRFIPNAARTIRFVQLVHDIPVGTEQSITVRPDGRVTELVASVVDATAVPRQTLLLENDAWSRAMQAARSVADVHAQEIKRIGSAQLYYKIADEARTLTPTWLFTLESQRAGSLIAEVNAVTGDATAWRADRRALGDDFRHYTYTTNTDPSNQVFWEDNEGGQECVAADASLCDELKYSFPADVVTLVNYQWETSRGADIHLCCEFVGGEYDDILEIVVDDPSVPGPLYRPSDQTMRFPPGPPPYSTSFDIVAHEVTHAYQRAENRSFAISADPDAEALNEGMADAMAGTVAAMYSHVSKFNERMGNPWVMGDGPAAVEPREQRDLTVDRTWEFFRAAVAANDPWTAGMAIGNFYYRLRASGVITDARLVEFQLKVIQGMRDSTGNGWDLEDFRDALNAAVKPGETALQTKITEIWTAMSPPPPATTVPPAAPAWVDGLPIGCCQGWSQFRLSWAPSTGASGYHIYANWRGVFEYLGSDTATFGYLYVTVNADARVRAWNRYGTSGLSADGYFATHSLCGF